MKAFIWLFLSIFLTLDASAASISWIATGQITQIESDLVTDLQVGDLFTLRINFDSLTPDLDSSDDRGRYLGEWITLDIGTYQAQNLGSVNYAPQISVSNQWNGAAGDELTFNSGIKAHSAPLLGDRELVSIVSQFRDDQGSIFNSDSLPSIPPDLELIEQANLELLFSNNYTPGIGAFDARWIYGNITSITAVPVPTAFWLFGSGLIGLLSVAKRKFAHNVNQALSAQ